MDAVDVGVSFALIVDNLSNVASESVADKAMGNAVVIAEQNLDRVVTVVVVSNATKTEKRRFETAMPKTKDHFEPASDAIQDQKTAQEEDRNADQELDNYAIVVVGNLVTGPANEHGNKIPVVISIGTLMGEKT